MPVDSVTPIVLVKPVPTVVMPFGFAITTAAGAPNTSSGPFSRLANALPVEVTWLTITLAARPDRFGFARTSPPVSEVPDIRLLLRISPTGSMLNDRYWFSEMPAAFGAVMLTTGTPPPRPVLCVTVGWKRIGAVGSVIGAASASPIASRMRSAASSASTRGLPAASTPAASRPCSTVMLNGPRYMTIATIAATARCQAR